MTDTRYQHQPPLIKCYRWLRWMPLYKAIAVWEIMIGKHDMGPANVWRLYTGLAHARMRYVYTQEEVFRNTGN